MRIRYKGQFEGDSSHFNTHALAEALVYFDDGSADSAFLKDLEVQLPDGSGRPFHQALNAQDIITDNYNTRFFYPPTEEDQQRGFTLYGDNEVSTPNAGGNV